MIKIPQEVINILKLSQDTKYDPYIAPSEYIRHCRMIYDIEEAIQKILERYFTKDEINDNLS